jgi:hypothetical protein
MVEGMMLISQAVTMVEMNSILAILDVMFYWSIITLTIGLLLNLRPIKYIADAVNDHGIIFILRDPELTCGG